MGNGTVPKHTYITDAHDTTNFAFSKKPIGNQCPPLCDYTLTAAEQYLLFELVTI